MHDLEFTLWPASVRLHPFEAQVRAAAAGGFTALAVAPTTYLETVARGVSARDMLRMAGDAGISLSSLDTLTSWAPNHLTNEFDAELLSRWSISLDQGFEACAELELRQILACAAYRSRSVATQQLVDGFGALCERAARAGIWVDLEPMPFTGCRNIADAWAVVGGAERENSGILMDAWHFYRANQDLDAIANIPGRYFRTMQVNDAPAAPVGSSLFEETVRHRRFPGDGELPVTDFIRAVLDKGALRSVGPEVFSSETDLLEAEESGRIAGRKTRDALAAAGVVLPSRGHVARP
ncbi:MAG: sugar phosphate isomerase/epimerase [Gluconacetobacter diazotrophicus]|nr:sugar phosphate isomerase/epimerase [Gluconacetobacter diazotrophicus]